MFPIAHRRQSGFTYLSLVILLAIIGLVTASAIKLGAMLQRSKAEQELLLIGAAFSDALQSYAEATPAGQASLPGSLNDLLRDPRFPTPRRHLRKIFADPVTGRVEWGIVYAGDKRGVVAVYSLSNAKPVKLSNFPSRFAGFSGALKISDWKFSAASMTDKTPPSHELAARSSENVASARQSAKKTSETAEGVQTEASDEWAKPGFPSGAAPSSPEAGQIELPSRQNSQ